MKNSKILLLLVAHILLGLIANRLPVLATFHAWITLVVGLWLALTTRDTPKIILIAAYITGSELIWRMVGASVFYEMGKYAIIAILGIAFLKLSSWKNTALPILYFVFLTFSIPLTMSWFGINEAARSAVSFNLSGPLALAVSVIFFSQVTLNSQDLKRIAWAISIPIVSVFTIAAYSTLTASNIVFLRVSNFITSGGFGPNQVSAILGLGVVMMFMIINVEDNNLHRLVAFILFIAFLSQALITFSRGGIYNAGICILFAILQLNLSGRVRIRFLFIFILLSSLIFFIIIPNLNVFTSDLFLQRYADLDTSGRVKIALGELNIWYDNFIFGVGPGVSTYAVTYYLHGITGNLAGAHTEYTRLLAEHGVFGLFALLLLIIMAIRAYFKASKKWYYKMWVVVFILWPFAEMSHAATRIVAISFLFGLAIVNWGSDESVTHLPKNQKIVP
jgi:O-antigen ligase